MSGTIPVRPTARRTFLIFFALVILTVSLNVLLLFQPSFDESGRLIRTRKQAFTQVALFKLNPDTKVYELGGKPVIWQFWRRSQPPLFLRLITEAMQCRNPEFRLILLRDSDVYQYLPELEPYRAAISHLNVKHKSELFRVAILLRFGGVYLDSDTLPLDKLYPLYALLKDYDIIGAAQENSLFSFGGLGPVRSGTSAFKLWYQAQIQALEDYNGKFKRVSYGGKNRIGDPFRRKKFLQGSMKGVEEELEAGRTTYLGYNGTLTVSQLSEHGLNLSLENSWVAESSKFLPLNWAPFLLTHSHQFGPAFWNATEINQLLPGAATSFSVIVGCALMDCWGQLVEFGRVNMVQETALGRLDVVELINALVSMNKTLCRALKTEGRFDMHNYKL